MSEEIFCMERAKGASIGATIVGFFGAAWLMLGMMGAGVSWQTGLAAVLPVFILIGFLGALVRRRLPKTAEVETPEKKHAMLVFVIVNVVQWVGIFGVANLLANLHLKAWIVPAIVLIVGAHFLPLARIFQAPQHVKTGIAMMLCAAAAVVLPISIRDTVECVTAGLILWISAAGALHAAFRLSARGSASNPVLRAVG
ncbi:MAG: hypothetical protein WBQ79_03915 [Acidobacteriaceae bacterium]